MFQQNVVTVTGKIGPGDTIISQVFTNVNNITFDYLAQTVTITLKGKNRPVIVQLDDIATVTYTISGGIATVTIST